MMFRTVSTFVTGALLLASTHALAQIPAPVPAPAPAAVMDCSGMSSYKKIACEASNRTADEAMKDQVPQTPSAPAVDCSKMSSYKKIACEAAKASSDEALKAPGK